KIFGAQVRRVILRWLRNRWAGAERCHICRKRRDLLLRVAVGLDRSLFTGLAHRHPSSGDLEVHGSRADAGKWWTLNRAAGLTLTIQPMTGCTADGEQRLTLFDLLTVSRIGQHLRRRSDHAIERAHHEEPEHQQQCLGCRVSAPRRQESHSVPSRVLMQVWAKQYSVVMGRKRAPACDPRCLSKDVDDTEQRNPHDVDKVPVV